MEKLTVMLKIEGKEIPCKVEDEGYLDFYNLEEVTNTPIAVHSLTYFAGIGIFALDRNGESALVGYISEDGIEKLELVEFYHERKELEEIDEDEDEGPFFNFNNQEYSLSSFIRTNY